MSWWRESRRHPRSRPLAAQGGIRAQSKRGDFASSWWAKRWVQVLESFDLGGRLSRGRSYARNGQVTAIAITRGLVKAKVQGSRPKPYDVAIGVNPLTEQEAKDLKAALRTKVAYAAKLLSGEMPEDIEQLFKDANLSLFPARSKDLQTECSCPDWSNPCKHVAAVYYLIGEEFDRDPFLIFKLRGIDRAELLEGLESKAEDPAEAEPSEELELLPADAARFWAEPTLPADFFGPVQPPPQSAALLRRLGNVPFWRAEEPLLDALAPLYANTSAHSLEIFLGEDHPAASAKKPRKRQP